MAHAVDPLTPEEMRAAAAALRGAHPEIERIALLVLDERKDADERRVRAVTMAGGGAGEAVVAGSQGRAWRELPGGQPAISAPEGGPPPRAPPGGPRLPPAPR